VAHHVDVVGDGTGIEDLEHVEWRLRREHHHLADILQREPDLIAGRSRRDVRAERRLLLHPADHFVIGYRNDVGLGSEARADETVLAVGREDGHARAVRDLDAGLLGELRPVEHGNVVLPADRHPHFLSVGREERLARRSRRRAGLLLSGSCQRTSPRARRMTSISCFWATTISCASRFRRSSLPYRNSARAMSIAPWWCGIIMRAKSRSASPL